MVRKINTQNLRFPQPSTLSFLNQELTVRNIDSFQDFSGTQVYYRFVYSISQRSGTIFNYF